MDSYLCEIKDLADSLAAINSLLTDQELIQCMVSGLDDDNEIFSTATIYFGSNFIFDDLRTKLILYELQVLHIHQGTSLFLAIRLLPQ